MRKAKAAGCVNQITTLPHHNLPYPTLNTISVYVQEVMQADVPHVRQLCPEHAFEKKGGECNAAKCAEVRPSITCVYRL